MAIAGFSYSRINVERKGPFLKGIQVKNNVQITNIRESGLKMGKDQSPSITVDFEFGVDYESAGRLELQGHVLVLESAETIKKTLEHWNKDKKVITEIGTQVYDYLLVKCNVKILQLEEDIGLPLHIKMPSVHPKK